MPKYHFHVVGIRHHDYKDRLEELYAKAEGNSMSMHIEEENVVEKNAIRVDMVSKFVGYVMSGREREIAEELLRSERLSLLGRVVEIDREHRMITLEVDTDVAAECRGRERENILKKWNYNGELLRQHKDEVGLKGWLDDLQMHVEHQSPYNDVMKEYIDNIQQNLWRDAGTETQRQMNEILQIIVANSDVVKGYDEAARKIRFILTDVNSPEQRQLQVDYLYELSRSNEMRLLIQEYGYDGAKKRVNKLPKSLVRIFDRDPQEYIGNLRYLPSCPYKKTRQLQTLMAMRIALNHTESAKDFEIDDVLKGGEKTLDNLSFAIANYYQKSPKNLALIYCVLRDNDLLVEDKKYSRFVQFLVYKELLPWMNKGQVKNLTDSMSQYMRIRKDHDKIKDGFDTNYRDWDECKERLMCEEIARLFMD